LSEQTRQAIDDYLKAANKRPGEFLFTGRRGANVSMTTRQYARLVSVWIGGVGLDPRLFETHSLRCTRSTPIYRRTGTATTHCGWRRRGRDSISETGASNHALRADRGYDADWIRELARQQCAWANIPPETNSKDPVCFSPYLYRERNLVERFFNKLISACRNPMRRYRDVADIDRAASTKPDYA
jgi:transposase